MKNTEIHFFNLWNHKTTFFRREVGERPKQTIFTIKIIESAKDRSSPKDHQIQIGTSNRVSRRLGQKMSTASSVRGNDWTPKSPRHNSLYMSNWRAYLTKQVRMIHISSTQLDKMVISANSTRNLNSSVKILRKRTSYFSSKLSYTLKGTILFRQKRSTLKRCWRKRIRLLIDCKDKRAYSRIKGKVTTTGNCKNRKNSWNNSKPSYQEKNRIVRRWGCKCKPCRMKSTARMKSSCLFMINILIWRQAQENNNHSFQLVLNKWKNKLTRWSNSNSNLNHQKTPWAMLKNGRKKPSNFKKKSSTCKSKINVCWFPSKN